MKINFFLLFFFLTLPVYASGYFLTLNHSSYGTTFTENGSSFTINIPTEALSYYVYQAEGLSPLVSGSSASSSVSFSTDFDVIGGIGNYMVIATNNDCDTSAFSDCINGDVLGYASFSITDHKTDSKGDNFLLVNTTIIAIVALFWLMLQFIGRK